MHQLFSSHHRLPLSLALFFIGTSLHAQQTTLIVTPPAPTLAQTAAVSPTLDLSISPYISSSAIPDAEPAAPAAIDAPQPQSQAEANQPPPESTARILGIIPGFRPNYADVKLPPQTVKQKFAVAFQRSFNYTAIFVPLAVAGYDLATNPDPEFGHGGVAYGRYLWHEAVDQTSENFLVLGIVPSITHEDNRYYTLGHGGFYRRTGYALSRAIITRSDSGNEVFNASEIIGSGAAAGISTLYYPAHERTFENTTENWGLQVGIDAAVFVAKEFWPDVSHRLFHTAPPAQTLEHKSIADQ